MLIVLQASVTARWYVYGKGCVCLRCGVTEREDQSVCIDWTCKAQDVDSGRQIPRKSRVFMPITHSNVAKSVPFGFQENRRTRECIETVP